MGQRGWLAHLHCLGRRRHWMEAWTRVPLMGRHPATPTWTQACSTSAAMAVPWLDPIAWGLLSPPWDPWTLVPGPRTTRDSTAVRSISASRVSIYNLIYDMNMPLGWVFQKVVKIKTKRSKLKLRNAPWFWEQKRNKKAAVELLIGSTAAGFLVAQYQNTANAIVWSWKS